MTFEELLCLHGDMILVGNGTAGQEVSVPFTQRFSYTYTNIIQAEVYSSKEMDVIANVDTLSTADNTVTLGLKYEMAHNEISNKDWEGNDDNYYLVCPCGSGIDGFYWVCKCNDKANYLFQMLEVGATEQELISALLDKYEYITRTEAREGIQSVLDIIQPSRITGIIDDEVADGTEGTEEESVTEGTETVES